MICRQVVNRGQSWLDVTMMSPCKNLSVNLVSSEIGFTYTCGSNQVQSLAEIFIQHSLTSIHYIVKWSHVRLFCPDYSYPFPLTRLLITEGRTGKLSA